MIRFRFLSLPGMGMLRMRYEPFASEQAINIHFLERFVGDYGIKHDLQIPHTPHPTPHTRKVAVVGSGPAGLCCAGELARQGIKVVIFESLRKSGGVVRYGIPPFRLPQDVLDFEISYLEKLGVEIVPNVVVGRTKTLDELFKEGFECIFLGLGAGVPSFMNIGGEKRYLKLCSGKTMQRIDDHNTDNVFESYRRRKPSTQFGQLCKQMGMGQDEFLYHAHRNQGAGSVQDRRERDQFGIYECCRCRQYG